MSQAPGSASLQLQIDSLINTNGKPAVQTAVNNSTATGPAAPINQISGPFRGINFGGTNDADLSNSSCNAIEQGCKSNARRTWLSLPMNSGTWTEIATGSKSGYANFIVLPLAYGYNPGPQPQPPPSMAVFQAMLNQIPPASQIGQCWFECNEMDYNFYFTPNNPAAAEPYIQAAHATLTAKGHKFGISILYGASITTWLGRFSAATLACLDFCGHHAYDATAQESIAEHQTMAAWCKANKILMVITELGLHANPSNLPQWATMITQLIQACVANGWSFIYFVMRQDTVHHAGPEGLIGAAPSTTPTIFFPAVKSGLA